MSARALTVVVAGILGLGTTAWAADPPKQGWSFGKDQYMARCAPCHDASGKGGGPAAKQVGAKVPDITTYAKRNGGAFPTDLAWQKIDGRPATYDVNRQMPVWGADFRHEALVNTPRTSSPESYSHLVRATGYFRLKARRLKNLIDLLVVERSGDLGRMGQLPTGQLRGKLLAVNGIGPETADSILLYAFRRPVFVVDAYTLRVMSRHRLILPKAAYGKLQGLFMAHLPPDEAAFNEYHALLVQVGKRHCRRTPSCSGCPLETLLP